MTFEEFFKKKKIDLVALQAGQPGLFSEFKEHYEQMGEKSFDHTKKYWFNKLRLQYRLAPEIKIEKVHIENRLAEQTITESLTEPVEAKAATGFKPRFKAATTKPADTSDKRDLPAKESATITPELKDAAANHNQDPAFQQEKEAMQEAADQMPRTTDGEAKESDQPTTLRTGFKPRFNMKMAQGNAPQTKEFSQETPSSVDDTSADKNTSAEQPTEATAAPKPAGFKPRFNAKTMVPKKEQPANENELAADLPPDKAEPEQNAEAPVTPKPAGFKPRVNAKMMAPKKEELPPAESVPSSAVPADSPAQEPPAEVPAASKPSGFKPRFNAKTTKPQPPTTEE